MKSPFILTAFLFFLTQNLCIAQEFNVRTYSFKEGLNTYNIKKVLQDKYGFIWLATQDGVYRYDGTSFESFRKSSDADINIRENFITDIALGNDENLYVASFSGGVEAINIRTQKITHLLSETSGKEKGLPNLWITKIFCDTENNLWVGGKDFLKVYSLNEKTYKDYQKKAELRSAINVSFIRPVNKNTIAIGAVNFGVLFYNINSFEIQNSIKKLEDPGPDNITATDLVTINDSCYISSGSNIFSGKIRDGVWMAGREINTSATGDYAINCMMTKNKNELWVGTNNGLGKIDMTANQFDLVGNTEFANNFITDLFVDNENGLWVSSLTDLSRMSLQPSPFAAFKGGRNGNPRMNHIYSLVPVNETKLFACGTDGLYLCDIVSEEVNKINGTAALGIIHYVFKKDEDFWLICSDDGMYGYRPSDKKLSKDLLLQKYPEWRSFINNYFNNTIRSGDKIYWASEEQEGLIIWNLKDHTIEQMKAGGVRSGGIPENHIHNLKLDKDGFLWLLFDKAVAKFDLKKDSVIQLLRYDRNDSGFKAGVFFDMYDDGSVLWFGTYGGGINGYDKKTGQWTYITEQDGLCNNAVYGILPGKDSIFWVSTNNGLSRVNYKIKKCLNYFVEDGLHDNSFDEKGALSFDGKLFFAGVNGFTSVKLDNYKGNSYSFPVYIKKLEYIKKNNRITLNDIEWKNVQLPPGTSNATIWLSALSFTNNKPRFSYKIKGFQNEFLSVNDENKIELNALKYGDYEIDIRYLNEKGDFVEDAVGINLEILPFWYQTWWFRMLVAIVALSIIIFIVRLIYISRLRKQRALLEKQLAIQFERQRISAEMHDDIGAGLSGIRLLTEMTKGKVKDTAASSEVEKIYESVGDISAKMKEVIWSLNTENDELSSLISYIQRQARSWLEHYPCQLTITIPEKIPDLEIDGESRRNIFLTVKEAIHNIIKHSGADKVTINIACDEQLIITVSDNGKGMHVDENSNIGNGLKNMKQRIHQLNGKIFIQNQEGFTLKFEIPYKQFL
ncbi:MAG TPA: ATP-binding protein [Chitinophagaceae bacterium]|nr:ATP-binding protein [Chitinophagaceae bacterium]